MPFTELKFQYALTEMIMESTLLKTPFYNKELFINYSFVNFQIRMNNNLGTNMIIPDYLSPMKYQKVCQWVIP